MYRYTLQHVGKRHRSCELTLSFHTVYHTLPVFLHISKLQLSASLLPSTNYLCFPLNHGAETQGFRKQNQGGFDKATTGIVSLLIHSCTSVDLNIVVSIPNRHTNISHHAKG